MEDSQNKPSWGDIEEAEDDMTGTKVYEVPEDETGTRYRTVVEYSTNEEGKTIKKVKKYKVYKKKVRISRAVEARKKWEKFGDCKIGEQGVTILGEWVTVETTARKNKDREDEAISASEKGGTSEAWVVRAARLGASSWDEVTGGQTPVPGDPSGGAAAAGADGNVYVPRSLRKGADGTARGDRDDSTIRVTNLSEDTREDDLRELCRRFGPIQRVYLARDRNTNKSRGFAFVTFVFKEDAQRAIEGLHGYGYDHLILNVEWAKPSKPF